MKKLLLAILALNLLFFTLVMVTSKQNLFGNFLPSKSVQKIQFPELTPWKGIGGCAAGGSGTKSGSIRWIGEETGNGLLQITVMPTLSVKKLSRTFSTT
ncbi:MAG TPA: hypothetical protein VHO70_17720, partial [Chitinispirillaceae bacterium]|nr:hypothetical protein [Chitinispirillaceae bacterium]